MTYPAPLSQFVPTGIACYMNQAQYKASTGKAAPAYDPSRPIQLWADRNTAPSGDSPAKGFVYNFPTVGVDGFARTEQHVWPFVFAATPNIPPDSGPYAKNVTLPVPMRDLGATDEGQELLASSPWGYEVVDSANLNIGMLKLPPEVLASLG